MREQKLRGIEKAELQLMNAQMTVLQWLKYCVRNNVGLIIEDGKVTGLETKPKTYK